MKNISNAMLVSGGILSGAGSLLLAWRVKKIFEWVKYTLVAHEINIRQIVRQLEGKPQDMPITSNVTKHLLDVEGKIGLILLILGLTMLGMGAILQAVGRILGAN